MVATSDFSSAMLYLGYILYIRNHPKHIFTEVKAVNARLASTFAKNVTRASIEDILN
ncbi:hypothetical protein QUF56_08450 [Ureibacillus composti]|nr:hypothetical protein [Ureibacillus composti]